MNNSKKELLAAVVNDLVKANGDLAMSDSQEMGRLMLAVINAGAFLNEKDPKEVLKDLRRLYQDN